MTYQNAAGLMPVIMACCTVRLALAAGRALARAGHTWYRVAAGAAAVAGSAAAAAVAVVSGARAWLTAAASSGPAATGVFLLCAQAALTTLLLMFAWRALAGRLAPYEVLRRVVDAVILALAGMVAGTVVSGAWQASSVEGRASIAVLVWLVVVAGVVTLRRWRLPNRSGSPGAVARAAGRAMTRRSAVELADTARHEAAHAVVAVTLGLEVDQVDVVCACSRFGATRVATPAASTDNLYDLMTVFLAGDVAVVSGRGPELGAADDVSQAASAALAIVARDITPSTFPPGSPLTLEELMRAARSRAAQLLAGRSRATAALVERLMYEPARPVTGAELAAIVPTPSPAGAP